MRSKTLLKRFIAVSIDTSLAGILYVALAFLLFRFGLKNQVIVKFFLLPEKYSNYSYAIGIIMYFLIQESLWGRTIAKKLMGLYVVNEDLSKPTIGQATIRNFFRVIDQVLVVGSAAVFFNKRNQRLGDIVAKTYVVDKKELEQLKNNGSMDNGV